MHAWGLKVGVGWVCYGGGRSGGRYVGEGIVTGCVLELFKSGWYIAGETPWFFLPHEIVQCVF